MNNLAISFTNPVLRQGETLPVGGYDYLARVNQIVGPIEKAVGRLLAEVVYTLPDQAGSEGDRMDLDLVDGPRFNRMVVGARPRRVGVYTGFGEAGNRPATPEGLKRAARAFRGAAYVVMDKASYPEYIGQCVAMGHALAEVGVTPGFEANADTPELRQFLREHPGTLVCAESWLWVEPYLKGRLPVPQVQDLGGVAAVLVNRRVARKGTVGWVKVAPEDWAPKKVQLAGAFMGVGAKVILRATDIDVGELEGVVRAAA